MQEKQECKNPRKIDSLAKILPHKTVILYPSHKTDKVIGPFLNSKSLINLLIIAILKIGIFLGCVISKITVLWLFLKVMSFQYNRFFKGCVFSI